MLGIEEDSQSMQWRRTGRFVKVISASAFQLHLLYRLRSTPLPLKYSCVQAHQGLWDHSQIQKKKGAQNDSSAFTYTVIFVTVYTQNVKEKCALNSVKQSVGFFRKLILDNQPHSDRSVQIIFIHFAIIQQQVGQD